MEQLFTLITLLVLVFNSEQEATVNLDLQQSSERLSRGRTYLERLETKAKLPTPSDCWRNAIRSLKSGCSRANDIGQSYLAVRLTNCHLEKSGLKIFPCKETDSIESCTKPMTQDSLSFIVYTEFFTHVSDICFYLQSELWQEETSKTISKLTSATSNMANKLDESLKQQGFLLEGQDVSLRNQKEIMKNEQYLKSSLQDSAETVQNSFAKIREEATMQRDLYSDTFKTLFQSVEKLTKLQNMLLGEFMSLQSVAFYLIVLVASYLFTSTSRTAGARLPLFVLMAAMIFVERCLTSASNFGSDQTNVTTEQYHHTVWFIRKLFLLAMTLVFGYVAMSYRDLNKLNNQMLQSIEHHVLEMKKLQLIHVSTPLGLEKTVSDPVLPDPARKGNCKKRLLLKEPLTLPTSLNAKDMEGEITSVDLRKEVCEIDGNDDRAFEDGHPVYTCDASSQNNKEKECTPKAKTQEAPRPKRVQKKEILTATTVRYTLRSSNRESISSTPKSVNSFYSMPDSGASRPPSSKKSRRKGQQVGHRPFFSSDEED